VLIPVVGCITNVYAHEWALVDEAAMSAAVERLITRPAARAGLSAAGRRHVARLTWDAAAGAFHDLLSDPAAAAA
jgi:glycosyltransferase involved in cell wall biosynthesis